MAFADSTVPTKAGAWCMTKLLESQVDRVERNESKLNTNVARRGGGATAGVRHSVCGALAFMMHA